MSLVHEVHSLWIICIKFWRLILSLIRSLGLRVRSRLILLFLQGWFGHNSTSRRPVLSLSLRILISLMILMLAKCMMSNRCWSIRRYRLLWFCRWNTAPFAPKNIRCWWCLWCPLRYSMHRRGMRWLRSGALAWWWFTDLPDGRICPRRLSLWCGCGRGLRFAVSVPSCCVICWMRRHFPATFIMMVRWCDELVIILVSISCCALTSWIIVICRFRPRCVMKFHLSGKGRRGLVRWGGEQTSLLYERLHHIIVLSQLVFALCCHISLL